MTNAPGKPNGIWTISNVITIIRILLVPLFLAVLVCPWPEWFGMAGVNGFWKRIAAAVVFLVISGTDWLDGYLARRLGQITDFGKFMDPLADKILVATALVALVELGALPTWVVMIILAREFIVSGVRMMAASKGVVIAASMLGKCKTVSQMAAIVLFTVKESHAADSIDVALADPLWVFSWIVMIVALVLTIASMVDYLSKARDVIGLGGQGSGDARASETCAPGEAEVNELACALVKAASQKGLTVCTAESLTGGSIGSAITSVAGSSVMFTGGVVSYANEVKRDVLGVGDDVLSSVGAVSEQCAVQMAIGARRVAEADIAVSVTGIAGPGGAVPGKPVGTVWMGSATDEGAQATLLQLSGDRESIRVQTVAAALGELLRLVELR